ncbi:MAG: AraC family transcriptional regulator [Corynebacterium variabile]|uniref:helix-turn-helix transcriptional regulator n=1 Tax=Corynebacterium variabile TaxID=1727 RepID=UPI002649B88E|nr:AraC family transcriptional regulator [Corynebacterium variabile]MDN6535816.1 AraC family transcriptional regulator [Corynebacterium variabile]
MTDLALEPAEITAPFVILSEGQWPDVPTDWPWHSHSVHELVWVRHGTMTSRVRTDDGEQLFTVQERRAVWLPAGTPHSGQVTANVILCDAFFSPERTPVAFLRPTVVEMTTVLESLLTHLARPDLADAARARAEAVVFDVLEPAADQFSLPVPDDPRITRIVDTLLADPACPRALDGWARDLGISERTVTRAFRESTGLTYGQWRQSLRIRHAVTLLSAGHRVHEVSDQLGYTQPSTFIAAFHKVTGKTPGAVA